MQSPPMGPAERQEFKPGDTIFLASAGVGVISELATRDSHGQPAPIRSSQDRPAFYVVRAERVVACVPFERAAEAMRRLVDRSTAEEMLAVLRGPPPDLADPRPLLERGKDVVHSGSPLDHARLLRELYALPVPVSDSLGEGLSFVSSLVIPELALVLELSREELEREMRERHPAAADWYARGGGQIRFTPKP